MIGTIKNKKLTKTEFYILNNLCNAAKGRAACSYDIDNTNAQKDSSTYNKLKEKGYISKDGFVTDLGYDVLAPYKVDNAIILSAGMSSRFVPLSLELPKGLYEVKGERLIERQIQQLQDAGIEDITIVIGYKKQLFYYLEEKYHVRLVENNLFNVRNNIESLLKVKEHFQNTYVCVSDSYFIENPFSQYVYETCYSGQYINRVSDELYVSANRDDKINQISFNKSHGEILLGYSFWDQSFSKSFLELADKYHNDYSDSYWEILLADHLNDLPAMHYKKYSNGNIFEFDYFEELRDFDNNYKCHAQSEIIRNIKLIFRCDEEDIVGFRRINDGLTNTSFIFRIAGVDYVYRYPGDGTEKIISRENEKASLILAKKYDFDPTYVYADSQEGWKISKYIPEFRNPDYGSFDDAKKIINVLKRLHDLDISVDYGLNPWEDALKIENTLRRNNQECFKPYEDLKDKVYKLYQKTLDDGVKKCFCHGDTYKYNWMILPNDDVILIDWEYAGFSDPGIDVGYYIVDAAYEPDMAKKFIIEYLGDNYKDSDLYHYFAYIAIIAYYWFVWALYRVSCGANIGDSTKHWHNLAEKYSNYLLKD